jgi:YggT family protein
MQFQRVSLSLQSGNPFAPFIFAFTNWCVLPLRRLIPSIGRLDTASLLAAYLVVIAKLCVLTLMSSLEPNWKAMAVLSLLELVHLAMSSMVWIVIAYALLSWVRTGSEASYFLARLVEPLLAPLRSVLPLIGGIDLSPLALLVLLQILEIVINHLTGMLLL